MYYAIFILFYIKYLKKLLKIQNCYKIKAKCLHKLCSKFEVDIKKNWGSYAILFRRYTKNSHRVLFLSQIYQFLSQYYIYNKITTKYGILRLRSFQQYVFCQDYKPFWF